MKPYLLFFFYRKTASISLLGCQAALTPHRFDAPLKLHCKNFLLLHSERFANVNYSFIVKENCGKTTIWFDVILSMSSCHKFARQNNHWYLHFYVNKYFNILSKSVLRLPFVFSTTRLSSNVMIIAAFFSELGYVKWNILTRKRALIIDLLEIYISQTNFEFYF